MGLFLEWMLDSGHHREIVVDCPECGGLLMGYPKYFHFDSKGTFFRCKWCGAKIYQQNGFDGFVDEDGNPLEDDYDPMLTPVDPIAYDPTKKIIKSKGNVRIQRESMPNTKQARVVKKPTLTARPIWDDEGFDYSPGVEINPPKLYK